MLRVQSPVEGAFRLNARDIQGEALTGSGILASGGEAWAGNKKWHHSAYTLDVRSRERSKGKKCPEDGALGTPHHELDMKSQKRGVGRSSVGSVSGVGSGPLCLTTAAGQGRWELPLDVGLQGVSRVAVRTQ